MKKSFTLVFSLCLFAMPCLLAQNVPQGINYQCIIRNPDDSPVMNEMVTLTFMISEPSGTVLYSNSANLPTNDFGLINYVIGMTPDFEAIDWGSGNKFLTVSDSSGVVIVSSQLVSVPYALYALKAAESESSLLTYDPATHILTIGENGSNSVQLPQSQPSNWDSLQGIPNDFADGVDNVIDADSDTTNEIQHLSISGDTIKLSQSDSTITLPSATVYTAGSGITINGNTITNLGDLDPTNDITNTTNAGGDLFGTYPNPVIAVNAIGTDEIINGSILAVDLAPGLIPTSLPPCCFTSHSLA